jgi:tetratricopeptide (TPR) repeat protein
MIAHAIRVNVDIALAEHHVRAGSTLIAARAQPSPIDDLVASRFWRAAALWAFKAGPEHVDKFLDLSSARHADFVSAASGNVEGQLAAENTKVLLESRLKAASRTRYANVVERLATQLITLDSKDPDAHLIVGDAWNRLGEREAALSSYLAASTLATVAASIGAFKAGQMLELMHRPDDARDAYRSAIRLDPCAITARERLQRLSPTT